MTIDNPPPGSGLDGTVPEDVRVTTTYQLFTGRRWARIGAGIIGPLGIASSVVFVASGIEAHDWRMWGMVVCSVLTGVFFIAFAFRGRLLVRTRRVVERVPPA